MKVMSSGTLRVMGMVLQTGLDLVWLKVKGMAHPSMAWNVMQIVDFHLNTGETLLLLPSVPSLVHLLRSSSHYPREVKAMYHPSF